MGAGLLEAGYQSTGCRWYSWILYGKTECLCCFNIGEIDFGKKLITSDTQISSTDSRYGSIEIALFQHIISHRGNV